MRGLVRLSCAVVLVSAAASAQMVERPRVRDLGIEPGVLPVGPLNAITDVAGVRVGQVTIASGDTINTGVTAILPHGGNPFLERVPAAVHIGNAFGKLVATGLAIVFALQVFVVIGGVTHLIPLTGLTTPFLSKGGSSLVANWVIVALLLRISDFARRPIPVLDPAEEPDVDAEVTQVVKLG